MSPEQLIRKLELAVRSIRATYAQYGVELDSTRGVGRMLAEADELFCVAGESEPLEGAVLERLQEAFVLLELAESIEVCERAGQSVAHHLKHLQTGDADLGVPSRDDSRIHFKDFEYELFLMRQFRRKGLAARFGSPSGPSEDIRIGPDLFIEAKHLSTPANLRRKLRQFEKRLNERQADGIMAIALEDMFGVGRYFQFPSPDAFEVWMGLRMDEVHKFWESEMLEVAAECAHLLAVVQTLRFVPLIGHELSFQARANALVFDRGRKPEILEAAQDVVGAVATQVHIVPRIVRVSTSRTRAGRPTKELRSEQLKLVRGDRLGFYEAHDDGQQLRAGVWECVRSGADGARIELVHVVGAIESGEGVSNLHRALIMKLRSGRKPLRIAFDARADAWFESRRIPKPRDPAH